MPADLHIHSQRAPKGLAPDRNNCICIFALLAQLVVRRLIANRQEH